MPTPLYSSSDKTTKRRPETAFEQLADRYFDSWGSEPPLPSEVAAREHGANLSDVELPPEKRLATAIAGIKGRK